MMKNIKSKRNRKGIPASEEQERVALWMHHGLEDVYFQRDAQINFWTVLGGIAVAALLTRTTSLIERIQEGHWYLLLYFLTSITLIVNSWVQNLWGSLVLRVKVTMLNTFLMLMDLVCLSILCLQVTNPLTFFAACGFYILFVLLEEIYLMKTGAWVAFNVKRIKSIKAIYLSYLIIMILCFGAVAHLFLYPSFAAEVGWGAFAILASIGTMVSQHYRMEEERKELGVP